MNDFEAPSSLFYEDNLSNNSKFSVSVLWYKIAFYCIVNEKE